MGIGPIHSTPTRRDTMLHIVLSGAELRAGLVVLGTVLGFRLLIWWVKRRL